ncbi:MAG: ChaN family lipoprotein [Myxococcota bacterium]
MPFGGRAWPAIIVIFTLMACAGSQDRLRRPGPLAVNWRKPSQVLDGFTGSVVGLEGLWKALHGGRVVYVAERHDRPADHAVQLEVLVALAEQDPNLMVGMEMFRQSDQPTLDAFVQGDIDEATLQARTDWTGNWGFEYRLYKPIMDYARSHRIRIIGLNVDPAVTAKVAMGGLEVLSDAERAQLPELDLSREEHRTYVRDATGFTEGGQETHGGMSFEDLYTAQVIWDEVMADAIVRALAEGSSRMVVFAGRGHVEYRFGVPERAALRGAEPYRTVLPVSLEDEGSDLRELVRKAAGDFLWVMADRYDHLPHPTLEVARRARKGTPP